MGIKIELLFFFKLRYFNIYLHKFCWAEVSFWRCTSERQAARIRSVYLKTLLRQEIAFFDCETPTGEVTQRMSRDTILIQDAIGQKVSQ